MSEETTQQHVCGQCKNVFVSDEEYLDHKCELTGFNPTEPEHHGAHFKKIQEAALRRGEEKNGESVHVPEESELPSNR